MAPQPGAVAVEEVLVAGEVGVQDGVEVQGPGVVVVEGAVVAVAVPAVAEVPLLDAVEGAVDGGGGAVGLDAGVLEETGDGEAEEPPVVVDRGGFEGGQQPLDGALPGAVVEAVPEPGAGQSQSEGDGGGFDDGLAYVGEERPGVGAVAARSLRAGGEALGVKGEVAVRVLPRAPATRSAVRRNVRAWPSRPSERAPDQLGRGPGRARSPWRGRRTVVRRGGDGRRCPPSGRGSSR